MPTITVNIKSELHTNDEYGTHVDENGKHSGGPFSIEVSPKMTIEDLRLEIKVSEEAAAKKFHRLWFTLSKLLQNCVGTQSPTVIGV